MTIYLRWLTDAMLVRSALGGNRAAFGVLVERHLGTVHALAWSHTGSPVDADDVTQETFLRAFTKLDTLREADKFAAWLSGIARNLAADVRARALRTVPVSPELLDALSAPAAQPDEEEIYAVVRDAVLALEPPAREVLSLHYFAQKPMKEIAEIQGVSAEAAFKRLQRAREALGKELLSRIEHAPSLQARTKARKNAILALIATTPFAWKAAAATGGVSLGALGVGAAVVIVAAIGVAGYGYRDVLAHSLGLGAVAVQSVETTPPAAAAPAVAPVVPVAGTVAAPPGEENLGRIYGHTYDINSKPVAGAVVHAELVDWAEDAHPPAETFVREAVSDEHGAFEVTGLKFGEYGLYSVTANASDAGQTDLRAETPVQEVDGYLKPGKSITGRVVNEAGVAVAGASVVPFQYGPMGAIDSHAATAAARMVCDAEGKFGGAPFWPGMWRFRVHAPGYAPLISEGIEAGHQGYVFTLRPGGTVRGVVIGQHNQQPMAGVAVELKTYTSRYISTDADGRFAFADVAPGPLSLALQSESTVLASGGEEFYLATGETHEATLIAGGGGTISGRLVDKDTGEGIPGIRLTLYGNTNVRRDVTTDALGGFFQTALPDGDYCVDPIDLGEYLPLTQRIQVHLVGGREIEMPVYLQRGIPIRGRVLDLASKPVSYAQVNASIPGEINPAHGMTKEDGSFIISVPPRTAVVDLIAHDGTRQSEVKKALALSPAGLKDMELVLSIVGTATVEVVLDLKGFDSELAGQNLEINLQNEQSGFLAPRIRVNRLGSYTFSQVVPGRYQVTLSNRVHWQVVAASEAFEVAAGQEVKGVRLVTKSEGEFSIRGIVEDVEGNPLEGVKVDAIALIHSAGAVVGAAGRGEPVVSDSEGRFSIEGLPEGDFHVMLSNEGYFGVRAMCTAQPASAWAQGAEEVKIQLRQSTIIDLRLLDAETGLSLEKNVVVCTFSPKSATTDIRALYRLLERPIDRRQFTRVQDERFAVQAEPGERFVVVSADGYLPTGQLLSSDHDRAMTITLTPTDGVVGTVRSADGSPVSGATLSIVPPWIRATFGGDGVVTTTDVDGGFTLKSVGPGAPVYATHPAYALARAFVPEEGAFVITMSPGGIVEGNVTLLPTPDQYFQIECYVDLDGDEQHSVDPVPIQPDGTFRMERIPAGVAHMILLASPKGEGRTLFKVRQDVVVREGQLSRVTFNPADAETPPTEVETADTEDADAPTP